MIIIFDNQSALEKAIEVGHKAGICDCEDYVVDAGQNTIVFDDNSKKEMVEFITVLEENNRSSNEQIYFRARY